MGLDMYLNRRKYIGNKWKKPMEQAIIIADGVHQEKVSEIVEEAGYWRKANAIHKWFVDNVQDGNDDCKEYMVSQEQLKELLDTVNMVLTMCELVDGEVQNGFTSKDGKVVPIKEKGKVVKDPTFASEHLPVQEGFFFGGTQYNEYYVQDLKDTKEILEKAVKDDDGDYYYSSSW